jgi:hypothetical protein
MVLRGVVGVVFAFVALTGAARESRAQPITVMDNNRPLAGAQVSAMINGIKTPLGTTNASGQITIDPNDLNITKGTTVTVWIKTCEDGTVQVIMVPAGEEGECTEEGAQAGERCGCRRAGVIVWGNGPVTVDIGTGTVTQTTAGGAAGNVFKFGAGLDIRYMFNMEDVLNEVPGGSNASATTWAPGFQLMGEYQIRNLFAIGIDAGFSRMETELTFPAGVQTGDLDYYEAGVNAKLGIPTKGRVWPYVTLALHRTWNKADFEIDGLSDHRVHKTRRDGLGAGMDLRIRPDWDLRLEGLYSSTFEDHDSDEHLRLKFGLLYLFGGGNRVMTQERGGLYE